MDETTRPFLRDLVALSPGLTEAERATRDYWAPGEPPVPDSFTNFATYAADDLLAAMK